MVLNPDGQDFLETICTFHGTLKFREEGCNEGKDEYEAFRTQRPKGTPLEQVVARWGKFVSPPEEEDEIGIWSGQQQDWMSGSGDQGAGTEERIHAPVSVPASMEQYDMLSGDYELDYATGSEEVETGIEVQASGLVDDEEWEKMVDELVG